MFVTLWTVAIQAPHSSEYLGFMGVKLDPELNSKRGKEMVISTPDSKVQVWVVPTNEELMIAQDTAELVKG